LPGTNTLAYLASSSATKEKSFIALTPELQNISVSLRFPALREIADSLPAELEVRPESGFWNGWSQTSTPGEKKIFRI
jgi:hypothetical protein